jgi:hypothetical protein
VALFGFLKKKEEMQSAVSPVSRLDAPLPPPPPLAGKPTLGSLPPLPPLPSQAVKAPLPPPPAPRVNQPLPSMPKLGELPRMSAPIDAKPALPSLPPLPPLPAAPTPAVPQTKPILPPVMSPPQAPPAPVVMPPAPTPQPVKLENSKLQKALEELTAADFDFSDAPVKPTVAAAAPKPILPPKPLPRPLIKPEPRAVPKPLPKIEQHFVPMATFDAALIELKTTEQHFHIIQTVNERLGMIENQKKNHLDSLVASYEHIQKNLLTIDEKLFKVN